MTDLEFIVDDTNSFHQHAIWSKTFAWLPHKCEITEQYIWLRYAYCGRVVWSRLGGHSIETRWHKSDEHIIWELKR